MVGCAAGRVINWSADGDGSVAYVLWVWGDEVYVMGMGVWWVVAVRVVE